MFFPRNMVPSELVKKMYRLARILLAFHANGEKMQLIVKCNDASYCPNLEIVHNGNISSLFNIRFNNFSQYAYLVVCTYILKFYKYFLGRKITHIALKI